MELHTEGEESGPLPTKLTARVSSLSCSKLYVGAGGGRGGKGGGGGRGGRSRATTRAGKARAGRAATGGRAGGRAVSTSGRVNRGPGGRRRGR